MKFARVFPCFIAAGVLFALLAPLRAEEIILKDGQKIVGTIVGYENDMFRVETGFGIALIRKDKVASIQVTPSDSTKAGAGKPGNPPTPVIVKVPTPPPHAAQTPAVPPALVAPAAQSLNPGSAGPPLAISKIPTPPPPPVSHPIDAPVPAHLQDHVDGNTYVNDTFQFSMYKPPDWKIIQDVPRDTGSGIMAMGTDDELTLLIVDRQVWSGAPKLTSDQVEVRLRQTYQEYQRLSESSIQCDGQPAIRRTFTGILDGAEWHGVAIHVIRGNTVFGLIGLTSAETYQFQEAIFDKILRTLHFTGAGDAAAVKPAGSNN